MADTTPDPVTTAHPGEGSRAQLREDVAAYIRELIMSGQAAPGTLLRLRPVAERVGASVTPVREALVQLAQDGWVVQELHRGFRVAPVRRIDVEDSYRVLALLAGDLAARAAQNATPEAISELRRLDDEIAALAARDDDESVQDLNYRLHDVIYALADSPRLVWFVEAASRFGPRRLWTTIPGWLEHNRTQHTALIDAIDSGDAPQAMELMTEHMRIAGSLLLDHLDSVGFWGDEADG
jgi:DNA-binding GntR family transcriptional regulator